MWVDRQDRCAGGGAATAQAIPLSRISPWQVFLKIVRLHSCFPGTIYEERFPANGAGLMAKGPTNQVLQFIRKLATPPGARDLPDGESLARFTACHDEAAFVALLHRHGS